MKTQMLLKILVSFTCILGIFAGYHGKCNPTDEHKAIFKQCYEEITSNSYDDMEKMKEAKKDEETLSKIGKCLRVATEMANEEDTEFYEDKAIEIFTELTTDEEMKEKMKLAIAGCVSENETNTEIGVCIHHALEEICECKEH